MVFDMLETNIRPENRVTAEYSKTWAAKIRRINRFRGPESADALDILNLISADSNQRYGLLNDEAVGDDIRLGFDAFGLPHDGIDTLHRIVACGETYHPQSRMNVVTTAKRLVERGEIDTIVELGSGSGDNLFRCFHALDWPFRDKVEFFGLEFTEQGRAAAELLAGRQPGIRFIGKAFNYYQPDLDFLQDKPRRILFLTNHSIEQITVLPEQLFENLLGFPDAKVTHSEPVGWQAHPMLLEARSKDDAAFFRKVRRNMMLRPTWRERWSLDPTVRAYAAAPVSFNSAWWSHHKSYNTNLLPILEKLQKVGKISIDTLEINHAAGNPFNASTFIEWRPA